MALVLVIVGILLTLSLTLMLNLSKTNRLKKTQNRLETVRDALVGYMLSHGRLPYADANSDGIEDSGQYVGKVPYVSLGLTKAESSDAYGQVFDYDVEGSPAINGSLTDTTSQNICHQLGAYIDGVTTATTRVTLDGGKSFANVAFVILAKGNNKQYEGENSDGDRDYESQNPNSDDLIKWEGFILLYNKLGCGKEFYRLLNNSSKDIYVLGGDYSSCTKISNNKEAFIQKGAYGYSNNTCTNQIFSFSDCEQADFGSSANRDTKVEWDGVSVTDR